MRDDPGNFTDARLAAVGGEATVLADKTVVPKGGQRGRVADVLASASYIGGPPTAAAKTFPEQLDYYLPPRSMPMPVNMRCSYTNIDSGLPLGCTEDDYRSGFSNRLALSAGRGFAGARCWVDVAGDTDGADCCSGTASMTER